MDVLAHSPYPRRMSLWFKERFPAISFSSAAFMYLLPKVYLQSVDTGWVFDLAGCIFVLMNLFILRVLDEHKDFKSDQINNKHRVLQRGIVTLAELRQLGIGAAVIELLCFVRLNPQSWGVFAFVFLQVWIFCMFKEFFCPQWLRVRLFLYSFLHLLVSPLITLVLLLCINPQISIRALWLLPSLGFFVGWVYEISRKTKASDEETLDPSFSKQWGYRNALLAILACSLGSLWLTQILVVDMLNASPAFSTILVLLLALHILQLRKFYRAPSVSMRKANEGIAALVGVMAYVVPVILVWVHQK